MINIIVVEQSGRRFAALNLSSTSRSPVSPQLVSLSGRNLIKTFFGVLGARTCLPGPRHRLAILGWQWCPCVDHRLCKCLSGGGGPGGRARLDVGRITRLSALGRDNSRITPAKNSFDVHCPSPRPLKRMT